MNKSRYRQLLLLLPQGFRRRYGDEMVQMFGERLDSKRSRRERATVWLGAVLDVLAQAVRSRWHRQPGTRTKRSQSAPTEETMQDLRYAIRALAKSPGYTSIAVMTLAVAIGANSAIFSIVHSLLLRPPAHVERPEELVAIYTSDYSGPRYGASSFLDFLDFRDGAPALGDALLYAPETVSLAGNDGVARLFVSEMVSANYFDVLGARPALGRAFGADEADPESGAAVAVVSHRFWRRELGADPRILGTTLRLSGHVVTLVGVAPRRFDGSLPLVSTDFWLPVSTQALISGADRFERRGWRGCFVRGRLAPGATLDQAQAQLDVVASQLHELDPRAWTDVHDEVRRITVTADSRLPAPQMGAAVGFAALLMGAVAMVLLIACANVANLTLARAARRHREVAIRLSLGAGRARLIRQFLGESAMIGLVGGAGGALLALAALRFEAALRPAGGLEVALDLGLDPTSYAFMTAITLLTVLGIGLLPALRSSRSDLVPALKEGAETAPARFHWYQLRNLLVIAQVAASLLLLVGAGLFLRSLQAASRVDPGFDPAGIATAGVDLAPHGYDANAASELFRVLRERVAVLPDVTSVTVSDRIPLALGGRRRGVSVSGYEPQPGEDMEFEVLTVGPDFLHTLRMPLLSGREFTRADSATAPAVVMVNRSFARRFWPGESALGKRVDWGRGEAEVIGVVADAKYRRLDEETRVAFFLPLAQGPTTGMVLSARTSGHAAELLPALRAEVQALEPRAPLLSLRTYEEALAVSLLPQRVASWILTVAGGLGLLLAAVGLYGVIAYLVVQRRREVGLRLALGARGADVIRMIVARGLILAGIGAAVGIALAAGLSRFLAGFLFGVSPLDPAAFLLMALAAGGVATLASFVPARRAARVDPAVTLRAE